MVSECETLSNIHVQPQPRFADLDVTVGPGESAEVANAWDSNLPVNRGSGAGTAH